VNPNFPLYIPSKSRADSRLTVKALEAMRVPFRVVIEEDQYMMYAAVIDKSKLLVLDKSYQRDYNTCDSLGDSKSKGPGPARNFIWDHSISEGYPWHWVMDDNIQQFIRLYKSHFVQMSDGTGFRCMEDFVLRYENIAMAGPNYFMFIRRKYPEPPLIFNTRIYSCNLIRNDVPFRWRGRYNEDTILSLDMLKARWCTVQFNAFLQLKTTTQYVAGGNTEEFYADEGTLAKSRMQVAVHPDVSRLVWKFGRWHHHVDYSRFRKNKLIKKDGLEIEQGVNEYGMVLKKI